MTHKQKAFCDYYLESLNATQSAIKAGYSKKSAFRIGAENMQKPDIKKYINERLEKVDKKRFLSLEEILLHLSDIATNEKYELRDRLKAYDLILKRYPIEVIEKDQEIKVIIQKASDNNND